MENSVESQVNIVKFVTLVSISLIINEDMRVTENEFMPVLSLSRSSLEVDKNSLKVYGPQWFPIIRKYSSCSQVTSLTHQQWIMETWL